MILKGIEVANHISNQIKEKILFLSEKNIHPKLACIRVGDREDDISYERGIIKKFEALGVLVDVHVFQSDASDEDVLQTIDVLNRDASVHGILMFRPLPKSMHEDRIRNSIAIHKDVDCASDMALASIFLGTSKRLPCTARAVMEMLSYYAIPLQGKKVTVIGRSMVVGKPLCIGLLQENATVTMAHSKTTDMASVCVDADIVVVATGHVNTLTADMVSEKAVVIDVGINFVKGRLVGDVDFEGVSRRAASVSPVPGGVGSITTSVLALHVVEEAIKMRG